MKNQIGFFLQMAVLSLLPLLIILELQVELHFLTMPVVTVVGIVAFYIGQS